MHGFQRAETLSINFNAEIFYGYAKTMSPRGDIQMLISSLPLLLHETNEIHLNSSWEQNSWKCCTLEFLNFQNLHSRLIYNHSSARVKFVAGEWHNRARCLTSQQPDLLTPQKKNHRCHRRVKKCLFDEHNESSP